MITFICKDDRNMLTEHACKGAGTWPLRPLARLLEAARTSEPLSDERLSRLPRRSRRPLTAFASIMPPPGLSPYF